MIQKKVLYAEDESTSRKILEYQLASRGIQCDLAMDGTEALEKFKSGSYDLVILDRYMPGMDGDEVARAIRILAPAVPLIAITGDTSETDDLRQAGFQEVFFKPLRGKAHIAIIESYLV